jgi:hypothetical protein
MSTELCKHLIPLVSCGDCALTPARIGKHITWMTDYITDRYGTPYEHDWPELWAAAQEGSSSRGPLIAALHDGTCALCGGRWRAYHDDIRYDPDADGWVCASCGAGDLD